MYYLTLKVGTQEKTYACVALDPVPEFAAESEEYFDGDVSSLDALRFNYEAEFAGFSTKSDTANVEMTRLAKFLAGKDIQITDYDSPRWVAGGEMRLEHPFPLNVALVNWSQNLEKEQALNTLSISFKKKELTV